MKLSCWTILKCHLGIWKAITCVNAVFVELFKRYTIETPKSETYSNDFS